MGPFLSKNKKFRLFANFLSHSSGQTVMIAKKLSGQLKPGDIIGLTGCLGAGKTCFIKGIAKSYGVPGKDVASPTFVLLRIYKGKKTIYHFDLYRIKKYEELENIGYREYLSIADITLIEWADKLKEIQSDFNWIINIDYVSKKQRKIMIYKRLQKA